MTDLVEYHGDSQSRSGQLPGAVLPPTGEPAVPPSPFVRMHRLLKGRYFWAVLLTLIGLAGGGWLGYRSVVLKYQTIGMLSIRPYFPPTIKETELSRVMPMFDEFVDSQVQFIQDQRVLDKAMESDLWRKSGGGNRPEDQLDFRKNLRVTRRGQIIRIAYWDPDISVTSSAVRAVIDAYMQIYGEKESQGFQEREKVLLKEKNELTTKLETVETQMAKLVSQWGTEDLEPIFQAQLSEMNKIETAYNTVVLHLAELGQTVKSGEPAGTKGEGGGAGAGAAAVSGQPDGPTVLAPEAIARVDRQMADLLTQRDQLRQNLLMYLNKGFGSKHKQVVWHRKMLETIEGQIQQAAAQYNANPPEGDVTALSEASIGQLNLRQLTERKKQLQALLDTAKANLFQLGQARYQIRHLQEIKSGIARKLQEAEDRLYVLQIEYAGKGRINVEHTGYRDPLPVNTSSRRQRAVLGGGLGACLGLGLVMLLGLRDRKLRASGDTRYGFDGLRLLGILPQLPVNADDPEMSALTAYCVHHIRTLLQLSMPEQTGQVLAVTSPASGSGKTSLTYALGISFAGTGARTLLIDADLAGGGLTRRVGAMVRRRLGQVLLRQGLLSEAQLNEALRIAEQTGRRLGEVVTESGLVDHKAVDGALEEQGRNTLGLLDVLAGEALDQCIVRAGGDDLYIMPIGDAGAEAAHRLSSKALRRLLVEARRQFDVVLIDTGPTPSSLESSVVAAEADRVVLIVSRGEQRPEMERAVQFLHSIGARVEGLVFNRADTMDLDRSLSASYASAHASHNGNGKGEPVGQLDAPGADRAAGVVSAIRQPAPRRKRKRKQGSS